MQFQERVRKCARDSGFERTVFGRADKGGHWLNGYFAQWVPSLFLAGSFGSCLNHAVLKCTFPWRTRYPLSRCRIK